MSKHNKKHTTKHKNRRKLARIKRNSLIVVILVIIFIILKPKTKNNEMILVFNNEEITSSLSDKLFNAQNIVYMSFEDIAKYIDKTIYREDENTIVTTSSRKVACLEIENSTIIINGAEKTLASGPIKVNEKIFLPISEMGEVYDIDFKYSKTSNIVVIENLLASKKVATAKKNFSIKEEKNIFSDTLDRIKKDDKVVYLQEEGKWTKIMSKDGYIGYVKTNKLSDITTEREEFTFEEKNNDDNYLEKNVLKSDISSFEKRQDLVQSIFTEAIEKDKKQIKIIGNIQDENFNRLEIEAITVFRECGLQCEFLDSQI